MVLSSFGSVPAGASVAGECTPLPALPSDSGFAVQEFINESTLSGPAEFQGFSDQGYFCPTQGEYPLLRAYTVTLPVSNEVQTQSIQLQLIVNSAQQGQSPELQKLPINGCSTGFSTTVDMFMPRPIGTTAQFPLVGGVCSGFPQVATQTWVSASAVASGVKTQTFLWVPSDNSTLSSLPLGLQRYTGEQDFMVVTADVAAGAAGAVSVPHPWGASGFVSNYDVSVSSGLVSFVVPRGQFMTSPFGQAVMGDSLAQYPSSNPPPLPIVGGTLAGMGGLECYWQDRAVAPGAFSPSWNPVDLTQRCLDSGNGMPGTTAGTPESVKLVADKSGCIAGNCGGVPLDPALEANDPAPALQALVMLNISSAVELDDLLAALLDNATGGLNGTFQDLTPFLPSLGLNPAVMAALPNVAVVNGGIFGIPVSLVQPPPPPPPSCSGFGCVWNTVSGVVTAFVNVVVDGVEGLAGIVWDAVTAAAVFFEAAAAGLSVIAEAAVSAAVSALKAVASALEQALAALAAFVLAEIETLFQAAFAPVLQSVSAYLSSVASDLARLYADAPTGDSYAFWRDVAGSLFLGLLAVSAVIVIALEIANVLSAGSDFVIEDLVILFVTVVIAAVLSVVLAPSLVGLVGASLSHAIEGLVNVTMRPALTGQWSCSWQKGWDAVSTPIGDLLDLVGLPFSVALLSGAIVESRGKLPGLEFVGRMLGLTVAILAILFDVAGAVDSKNGDHEGALTISVLGFEVAVFGIAAERLLESQEFSQGFQNLDKLTEILDYTGAVLALPALYLSGQNCDP